MKDTLLYQIQEMIGNYIEAEHKGAIQITDVNMEDNGYHKDDEERYLEITIGYIPEEAAEGTQINLSLGGNDFKAFVENISDEIQK